MAVAYVGLGSNLGDRLSQLNRAVERLACLPGCRVLKVSGVYESDPVGGPAGQGRYLNAVVRLSTECEAAALLEMLRSIEREMGRRTGVRWGPRPIDLDLLLFDELVVRAAGLVLPHPRMAERPFVLVPLAELAPELIHPTSGLCVGELAAACGRTRACGLKRTADSLTAVAGDGARADGHGARGGNA